MANPFISRQLNLFRGIAGVLMVLNHAGFGWLAPADSREGVVGAAVFLGSAAPGLFFFATGVGMGLSRRSSIDWPLLRKVLLLLVADTFLRWGQQEWLGLDFFGFCAVSMLAVGVVGSSRRGVWWALAAAAALLLARYAAVPWLGPLAAKWPALAFATGIEGLPGFSYPLSPWLALPLVGFVVGRGQGAAVGRTARAAAFFAAVLSCAASAAMAAGGAVVHRWGTVSFAYMLFGAGFVAIAWAFCGGLARLKRPDTGFLEIRGPASLLVVPIHYALIASVAALAPPPFDPAVWVAAVIVLVVATIAAAKWIASCLRQAGKLPYASALTLVAISILAVSTAWALESGSELPCLLLACAAEVLVAANLAFEKAAAPLAASDGRYDGVK